jgi:hypothetical protein
MTVQAQFDVEFRKDGAIFDENQVAKLLDGLSGLTNLAVFSHGWNNDKAEATKLYDDLMKNVEAVAEADIVPGAKSRKLGVVRVYWPSKKFAESDLIPGGGSASLDVANSATAASLMRVLDELKNDPVVLGGRDIDDARRVHLDRAQALVPELERSAQARSDFVQSIRAVLNPDDNHPEDGSAEFFTSDPETLFRNFAGAAKFTPSTSGGGATSLRDGGAANLIGDIAEGVVAAARRIANYATYSHMKTRAGTVGRTGVALVLARLRQKQAGLPLHLVGHSFGGRLVTAAASTLDAGSKLVTMMLLQAAYSHNGLGKKFDGVNDGAFRTVLADRRVSGPVLITHTKNDKAVGLAYPLASRIARDVAAALGDENDPYGGMGRNGAQHTPEANPGTLGDLDANYRFQPGQVFNLRADRFIHGHNDVTGAQVAYAFWHGVIAGS